MTPTKSKPAAAKKGPIPFKPNPKLDLVLERTVDVPRELVWRAWTEPKHLMKWFCPRPWKVTECRIDLRPGGAFYTKMCGPNGEEFAGEGCYLEVHHGERLVWTDAMSSGYRITSEPFFTGVVLLKSVGKKTKYTAMALHKDAESMKKHADMGFHQGWATALDQLVEHVKGKMMKER